MWPHARALPTDGGKGAVKPIWDGDLDTSSDFQQLSIGKRGREVGFTVVIPISDAVPPRSARPPLPTVGNNLEVIRLRVVNKLEKLLEDATQIIVKTIGPA